MAGPASYPASPRSEEHTSELQSRRDLVCRLLLEKKKKKCGSTAARSTRTKRDAERKDRCLRRPARPFRPAAPPAPSAPLRPTPLFFFFFNDTATTEIYTLSLHDALPISPPRLKSSYQSLVPRIVAE